MPSPPGGAAEVQAALARLQAEAAQNPTLDDPEYQADLVLVAAALAEGARVSGARMLTAKALVDLLSKRAGATWMKHVERLMVSMIAQGLADAQTQAIEKCIAIFNDYFCVEDGGMPNVIRCDAEMRALLPTEPADG